MKWLLLFTLVACAAPTEPRECPIVQQDTLRDASGHVAFVVEVRYCDPRIVR